MADVLDYNALERETFDAKTESARVVTLDKTPFVEWYRESQETGRGHRFVVPESAVAQTESLLRAAANRVGGGVSIGAKPVGNGRVQISFAAKAKKEFKGPRRPVEPKRRVGEAAAAFKTRHDKWNTAVTAWAKANPDAAKRYDAQKAKR